ncbi:MAG: hypothetical protein N3B18_12415 [Desulfobacterota bacterium]|nr:hypothetical protein [Thermodesulfobacteriota bacterium]
MKKIMTSLVFVLVFACMSEHGAADAQEKVGVLFAVHGGFDQYSRQHLWDASAQMFSYEPNHAVYQYALWCPTAWPTFLEQEQALKEISKYQFEYARIGGTDPFRMLTEQQLSDMMDVIGNYTCDVSFEFDWVGWMSGDDPAHYVYPRFIYNKPPGWNPPKYFCPTPANYMTYCGEGDNGNPNPWPGCDPQRYNVDGPVERLLQKGVTKIILVDLTVGGMRFSKTYDIYKKVKQCLSDYGQGSLPVVWLNDYNNLMQNSYPTNPVNWTPQWSYANRRGPYVDPSVPLVGNPNLITTDPLLATLQVDAILEGLNPTVPKNQTGVLLLNHALVDWAEYFDPKIDDTVALNQAIEEELIAQGFVADNIVGAYMGIRENGSAEGYNGIEYTRNMRGENLGHAWLYETNKQLPPGKWGYRYWDALEYLKNQGVRHIVIGFPQIITDSVLQLVEIPNQIAKEIGYKTWLKWGTFDYNTYPGIGHPFADYWGIWVDTQCKVIGGTGKEPCCFTMGGCGGSQPYPPLRQTSDARGAFDPSLAYDVSEYGHLGYNPALGPPDPNAPVQNQYTGTWEMYKPPSADPRVGQLLAKHVLDEFTCTPKQTLIELTELYATAENKKVTIVWSTNAEIDAAGFNIYRAEAADGAYVKINASLIAAQGSPTKGASYTFIDSSVRNRKTYYYKLEEVDLQGAVTLHGPVSATPRWLSGIAN